MEEKWEWSGSNNKGEENLQKSGGPLRPTANDNNDKRREEQQKLFLGTASSKESKLGISFATCTFLRCGGFYKPIRRLIVLSRTRELIRVW